MIKKFKAESFIAILTALTIFSMLFLSYSQWQKKQTEQLWLNYQKQQAFQIAENQLSLLFATQNCESQAVQNNITFTIQCQSGQIIVKFPLGSITVKSSK